MELMLKVNNVSDIKKVVRKTKIYKFIYKKRILKINVNTKLDSNRKYELKTIEKAFNIKNKQERLEYLYDRACEYMKLNYIDTNCCEFENNQCLYQINNKFRSKNGCCGNCKHLVDKACSINAISCKFYYCPLIRKKKKIIKIHQLNFLKCFLSLRQMIIIHFSLFQPK